MGIHVQYQPAPEVPISEVRSGGLTWTIGEIKELDESLAGVVVTNPHFRIVEPPGRAKHKKGGDEA